MGPQRDDVEIGVEKDKKNVHLRLFGSQGEQTLTAYVLKLSQAEIIKEDKKQKPIILADDIFAEIDENTQRKVLSYFQETEQVFLTATDLDRIKNLPTPNQVFRVSGNECVRVNATDQTA